MSRANTAYMSGEPVAITGVYEVVAADKDEKQSLTQPTIRELKAGEVFPNYDGRAVSWHLLSEPSSPQHETRKKK